MVDNLDRLDEDARGHTAVSRPSRYNKRPLIALVAVVPGPVKRLTVLHEAGLLIFDRDLSGPVSTRSLEERCAYKFAGAYLLPRASAKSPFSRSVGM